MMSQFVEESETLALDFEKIKKIARLETDVIPVVVQHSHTKEVLILAYVNEAALAYSLRHRRVAFWSTSRDALWVKGVTSGDALILDEVRVNCEQNSVLFLVTPVTDGVCHTCDPKTGKHRGSCFYRAMDILEISEKPGKLQEKQPDSDDLDTPDLTGLRLIFL